MGAKKCEFIIWKMCNILLSITTRQRHFYASKSLLVQTHTLILFRKVNVVHCTDIFAHYLVQSSYTYIYSYNVGSSVSSPKIVQIIDK